MNIPLNRSEQVSLALRNLYTSYGYRPYKVGKFEEYDLYAQNRSFLAGDHILTFSDTDGRLMALKPDVTLSIIKNTRDDNRLRKLWYTENVYRVPRNAYGFQEIVQTGLECIGPIDLYATAEVVMLAAESLKTLERDYVLDLSHIGILTGVLDDAGAAPDLAARIIAAVGGKNLHTLRAACADGGLTAGTTELLETLCHVGGGAKETLRELLALPLPAPAMAAAEELRDLCTVLDVFGDYHINLDLSVTNDTDYYNGVIFRGFVDGVASGVLSGGRYDRLVNRMGKTGGAVGFAVYVSELERLLSEKAEYDVDTLLVYEPGDDPASIARAIRAIAASGRTVRAQSRGKTAVTYRRAEDLNGREVIL
ncbi:MAG: ATP phosphoribosyltransferase regulatory subunit [Oscillospiraceae bacterium]